MSSSFPFSFNPSPQGLAFIARLLVSFPSTLSLSLLFYLSFHSLLFAKIKGLEFVCGIGNSYFFTWWRVAFTLPSAAAAAAARSLSLLFVYSLLHYFGIFPFPLSFPHSLPNPFSRSVSLLVVGNFLVKITFIPSILVQVPRQSLPPPCGRKRKPNISY